LADQQHLPLKRKKHALPRAFNCAIPPLTAQPFWGVDDGIDFVSSDESICSSSENSGLRRRGWSVFFDFACVCGAGVTVGFPALLLFKASSLKTT
jgi:hypothetical protein